MATSLVFSLVIFETTTHEVSARLERFQHNLQITPASLDLPIKTLREAETDIATLNIIKNLIIANSFILFIGGGASYLLARRALKPIKESHEAQSRFTSDASHELRTPLAAMKTEIEVAIRDKKATDKELKSVMKSTLEEVDKLTNLSQMLLDLSRLDHAKLKKTTLNIQKLTADVVRSFNVPSSRIIIKSQKRVSVLGNAEAIRELISILVDNALKYSPKDSQVVINLAKKEKNIGFEIINRGGGISENKLPHIFDRFYRADNSRTNRVGYGLGLSLAKKIVELSNGELIVTSTPGSSTIFTVLLPAYQRPKKLQQNNAHS
jgi:signal transduction histidine kinase